MIPTNQSPGPDDFTDEVHQSYKEELIPVLLKLFQKTEVEGTFPKTFYEATITLNQDQKHHQKRKLQASIFNKYRCKTSQQNISNQIQTTHKKKITHHDQVGFIPNSQGRFSIHKINHVIPR